MQVFFLTCEDRIHGEDRLLTKNRHFLKENMKDKMIFKTGSHGPLLKAQRSIGVRNAMAHTTEIKTRKGTITKLLRKLLREH